MIPAHKRDHASLWAFMAFLCTALAVINVVAIAASHTNRSDAEKLAQVMAMYRDYRKDFPEVREISAEAKGSLPFSGDGLP